MFVSVYTCMPAKPYSSEIAVVKVLIIKIGICRRHCDTKLQFNVALSVKGCKWENCTSGTILLW